MLLRATPTAAAAIAAANIGLASLDLAVVVDGNDVRVVQSCRRVSFPTESALKVLVLRQTGRQEFKGDDPVCVDVVRSPFSRPP
jgi:hypothetical protein